MKKLTMVSLILTVVAGLGAMTLSADAFWGGKGLGNKEKTQEMIQLQEKIHEAIAKGDYNQWKSLIGDRPMSKLLNESNFARFAEMKRLMWDGKFGDANKIREELGFQNQKQGRCGGGNCQGSCGFGKSR